MFPIGGLEACGLVSIFPLWGEAEVEVELYNLGSVQLQLQFQRQDMFPFGAAEPTDWLHVSVFGTLRLGS
jgi:hypothetical protein